MPNFWGDTDDDMEPLPDWMRADTYRNGPMKKPRGRSLEEIAAEALRKPPAPILLKQPSEDDLK